MIDHLRIFGCIAHIPDQKRKKLDDKRENAFFLLLVIIQKLINYIILTPIKLLLVVMLFFSNNGVKQNILVNLDGENNEKKEKPMDRAPQRVNDQSTLPHLIIKCHNKLEKAYVIE